MEETPNTPDQSTPVKKSCRRWLRFSLRTMMVAVTLLCIWLGVICTRANRQRRAVEAIEKAGGEVGYDYGNGDPFADDPPPPGPDWLRNLIGIDYFATVIRVRIDNAKADEDSFVALADLPELRSLILEGRGVTDSTLLHIEGLTQLESLSIGSNSITDTGLQHIKRLNHLEFLYIDRAKITDAGVADLKRSLPNLKVEGL